MHRSRVCHFVIDVDDLDQAVRFWSAALDATEEHVAAGSQQVYRKLRLPDSEIRILLQKTDDPKVAKERMHLDLETDDVEAEVERLEALGASRWDHQKDRGFDFWVMRDPWGNEFCVLQPEFPELLAQRNPWPELGMTEQFRYCLNSGAQRIRIHPGLPDHQHKRAAVAFTKETEVSETAHEDDLPLAELMHALAVQLQKAREWAARAAYFGEPSPIAWTDAQVEVGVTWTRTGTGELDLKVLRLGGNRTKENTATMTVSLAPAGGQPERTVTRPDRDSDP